MWAVRFLSDLLGFSPPFSSLSESHKWYLSIGYVALGRQTDTCGVPASSLGSPCVCGFSSLFFPWYLPIRPGVCNVRPILHSPWVCFPSLQLLLFATYQEDEFHCCSGLLLIHFFSFHMYEPFGLSINMQGPSLPSLTSLESFLLHIVNTNKQEIRSVCFLFQFGWGVPPRLPLPCSPLCPCPSNPVPSSALSSVHPN